VKSQFGWHIIKLEDRRTKPFPDFDEVKPQLTQYVGQKVQTELIMKLREGAKVERTAAPAALSPAATAPRIRGCAKILGTLTNYRRETAPLSVPHLKGNHRP
jgi:hypothetical protein